MTEITLTQNDKGQELVFYIYDENDDLVDISGFDNLTFKAGQPGSNLIMSGGMTLVSGGTTGFCKYQVTGGSLATVGTYDAEIQCDIDGNTIITVPNIKIHVRGEL